MSKTTVLIALAALTGILVSTITVGSIWVLYIEPPFISYHNLPFPHSGTITYAPGDTAHTLVVKCNSSPNHIFYSTANAMINEETQKVVAFPEIPLVATPGCQTESTADMVVPLDTPEGIYHFYGVTTVSGGYSMHNIPWETQSFMVKKGK